MRARQPGDLAIGGEVGLSDLLGSNADRLGRQQSQRKQAESAVGHDDQALGRPPAARDGLEQQLVELVGAIHVERRDVGHGLDRRGIERLAQGGHLLLEPAGVDVHMGKGDRPLLGYRPHEARAGPEIEREQRFLGPQRRANVVDG